MVTAIRLSRTPCAISGQNLLFVLVAVDGSGGGSVAGQVRTYGLSQRDRWHALADAPIGCDGGQEGVTMLNAACEARLGLWAICRAALPC